MAHRSPVARKAPLVETPSPRSDILDIGHVRASVGGLDVVAGVERSPIPLCIPCPFESGQFVRIFFGSSLTACSRRGHSYVIERFDDVGIFVQRVGMFSG